MEKEHSDSIIFVGEKDVIHILKEFDKMKERFAELERNFNTEKYACDMCEKQFRKRIESLEASIQRCIFIAELRKEDKKRFRKLNSRLDEISDKIISLQGVGSIRVR